MSAAIFLDKDGTIVEDVPYNIDPAKVRLATGTVEGLRLLQDAGYKLVVITNQSGVALGKFPESAVGAVETHLRHLLDEYGIQLDGFYYCPHHPEGKVAPYAKICECRKPQPGLIRQAARDLNIDAKQSWFIGDILNDVEAGHHAGCRGVLIHNGNETVWKWTPVRRPEHIAEDMHDAAVRILTGRPIKQISSTVHEQLIGRTS